MMAGGAPLGLIPELSTMPDDPVWRMRQIPSGYDVRIRGLFQNLRSHDQQHLACLHRLRGRMG